MTAHGIAKQQCYDALLHASFVDEVNQEQLKKNAEESLGLPLRFVPGWIAAMYERFIKIQELLKANPRMTHQSLFEEIHPFASRYYQGLKKLYPQPLDQIAFLYDKMGSLNPGISNDFESLLAQYPALGDEELVKQLSNTSYNEKGPTLSIEQAIQELMRNIKLDEVIRDYAIWLHQEEDPLKKESIISGGYQEFGDPASLWSVGNRSARHRCGTVC